MHVPPSRIFALATKLAVEATREEAERALEAWVQGATSRQIVVVADAARSSFTQSVWAWNARVALDKPIDDAHLDAIAPRAKAAVAAVLSMHRSGYVRELGTSYLAVCSNRLAIPFLALRLDDIVPSVRSLAEGAVQKRLRDDHASSWASALTLLATLRERERSKDCALEVLRFLARAECRGALEDACSNDDATVRRLALEMLSQQGDTVRALSLGLADSDTRVRLWAARTAISQRTTEEQKRDLLPSLLVARSAWIRSLGLRAAKGLEGGDQTFERALLDHHASVRHLARAILRARHPDRAFGHAKAAALRVLESPNATSEQLVGALGVLADVGLKTDLSRASAYVDDPRARVRREARRTVAMLSL